LGLNNGPGGPIESGFRPVIGTGFIVYAGRRQVLGIIENTSTTTTSMVTLRSVPIFSSSDVNTVITDVRTFDELVGTTTTFKYLLISYQRTGPNSGDSISQFYRVYGPSGNTSTASSLTCGGLAISGCKTCVTGDDIAMCDVCIDGFGKFRF
jgi:hypothetical protein